MSLALLFPGQGSQYVGMGRELVQQSDAARDVFEEADAVLNFSLSQLCFEGPETELTLTVNTQPAILTHSVAVFRDLQTRFPERLQGAAFTAGHSLGEYSANVAAGAMSFADALRLVRNRGRFMQEAVPPGIGAMAAIIGLTPEQVDALCEDAADGAVLAAANYNGPDQTVIAGHAEAVERAVELAPARGARRAKMLAVSAPFHCSLMAPARQQMRPQLEAVSFRDPAFPVVTNVDARATTRGKLLREALMRQIDSPVRWVETVRLLETEGVDRALEIGPGRVLAGLVRRIAKSIRVETTGQPASAEGTIA
jgi:[acyl-carrier-protein] S-malonyltransferase